MSRSPVTPPGKVGRPLASATKPRRHGRVCFHTGGPNTFTAAPEGTHLIELIQFGRNRFAVRYGLQLETNLPYDRAASELGAAIMHMLACNSELDNRMPGEKS